MGGHLNLVCDAVVLQSFGCQLSHECAEAVASWIEVSSFNPMSVGLLQRLSKLRGDPHIDVDVGPSLLLRGIYTYH